MCSEHSDMRKYADLKDLNGGFLGLITEPGALQAAPALGLDAAIVDQLRRLSPAELSLIAGTPGLLVCFSRSPVASLQQVAEAPATQRSAQTAWRESARLYATGLLTWLWQLEQHDWPCFALCTGSGETGIGSLGRFDFSQLRASADFAVDHLCARFCGHPSFWSDLIRSARSGNENFQTLSRLAIIPLVLAEACSAESFKR